ncbi:MAG: septum formation initiator family protein [Acidimicrobiia bacterium]
MSTRRRRRGAWPALLLLVGLAIVLAGIFPYRQILAQRRVVDLKQTQLEALETENLRLQEEVDLLHTSDEIERLARERFGLVRPGETQYLVVWEGGRDEPDLPAPPRVVPRDTGDNSWWDKVWGFITGADLEPGG